jgi:hypothetical protein
MSRISLHPLLYATSLTLLLVGCGGSNTQQLPPSGVAFVSSPPTEANEGSLYSYTLQANVQGANFALTSGPSGTALSGSNITWTPTSQQSRTANQFTVAATYAGATAVQSWTVTPAGTIRGTTAETCFLDSGQTVTTFLSRREIGDTVQVLVPNLVGGYDTYSSTVAQDGTFSIPNVPAGSFWLMSVWTKLWTSSSAINLGSNYWGGCHPESLSGAGTSLQISVNGLNPWQYTDYFYLIVPNAPLGPPWVPPATGATSLAIADPSGNLTLLNAADGDNAYAAQLVTATYGDIPFQSLQQFSGPLPVTIQNGIVNSLSTTLQSEPEANTVDANVHGSAFAALHSSMSRGPIGVTSPGDNFRIGITADNIGPTSNGLYLVLASHAFSSDTDAGDVPFANPYPPSWTPFVDYYDSVTQNLTPPGATSPFPMGLFNRVVTTQFPTASNPIAPLVGPALNPQINGVNLFQDQRINGTTPTLSWQPPALGTAQIYFIAVQEFQLTNGNPSLQLKAQLYTTNTSMPVPQGLLTSGNSYCFVIESLDRKNLDGTVAPYLETFPEGAADLVSGVITVQ